MSVLGLIYNLMKAHGEQARLGVWCIVFSTRQKEQLLLDQSTLCHHKCTFWNIFANAKLQNNSNVSDTLVYYVSCHWQFFLDLSASA